jgi:hypothetical protein
MDPLRWRPSPTPNFKAASLPPGLEVARARLAQLAGTPAAKELVQLLTGALPNLAEDAGKPIPTALLPAPLERLVSQLEALGIQTRDPGSVVRELRARIADTPSGRGFTPERMDALSRASGKGSIPGEVGGVKDVPKNPALAPFWSRLDADQKNSINIQQAMSKQSEAASFISNFMKSQDQANDTIRGNFK